MNTLLLIIAALSSMPAQVSDTTRSVGIQIVGGRNSPAEGICIFTTASTRGILTDTAGHAVVADVSDRDTLFAVLPGTGTISVPLEGRDSLKIKLRRGAGYRVIDVRAGRTTPVDVIDVPSILKTRTVTSLADLLQGMVPGLTIVRSYTGEVTSTIRGVHSLNLSCEPLVIVDGMEAGTLSDADKMVNIYDIQTITVDKDGSMYGVRGANGVIKIKTKGTGVEMY